VHLSHRYDIQPNGTSSRIVYTETAQGVNHVPYWLQFRMRPLSKILINRADEKQWRTSPASQRNAHAREGFARWHGGCHVSSQR
jgi:hypothetical protein